jgi:hypothetical protein
MVLRTPHGAGIRAPEHHLEATEAMLAHIPGLRVVIPSAPERTYGLLLAAIRDPDPVMFLEPTRIYRFEHAQSAIGSECRLRENSWWRIGANGQVAAVAQRLLQRGYYRIAISLAAAAIGISYIDMVFSLLKAPQHPKTPTRDLLCICKARRSSQLSCRVTRPLISRNQAFPAIPTRATLSLRSNRPHVLGRHPRGLGQYPKGLDR